MPTADQSMRGRICLVTGGTSGIGKETALGLARMGATVVIVGRNPDKTARAVEEIKAQSGNPAVEYLLADLSSLADVRHLAGQVRSRYPHLHVLINNAGGIFNPRRTTVDGLEMTFALNHLAPFLLTNLLLDLLRASAPARIITVSSDAHRGGRILFDDLQGERRYSAMYAYVQSKLANILFTYELARRLEGTGVTANCLHPGMVRTNFGSSYEGMGWLLRLFMAFGISPAKGAETVLYLAASPEAARLNGAYVVKKRPVRSSAASYDTSVQRRLWEVSAQLTGLST